MPVTSVDLLTAAIAPRLTFAPEGQTAPSAAGTPATASFENVLASAQAAATSSTDPTAVADAPVETASTGLSTIGDEVLTSDLSETISDLSELALAGSLAFLFTTTNDALPPSVAATEQPNLTTEISDNPPEVVPSEVKVVGATRTRSDSIRLAQSPSISNASTTGASNEELPIPTTTELPVEPRIRAELPKVDATLASPNNSTTTATMPADAGRAASRTPSVVAQAPIIVDRPSALPGEAPFVAERPLQPPTSPVPGVLPVSPDNQAPVNLRANIVQAQEAIAANATSKVASNEFATELRRIDAVASNPPDAVDVSNAPAIRPATTANDEIAVAAPPILATSTSKVIAQTNMDEGPKSDRVRSDADSSVTGYTPPASDVRPTFPFVAPATAKAPTPAAQLGDSIIEHASIAERNGKVEIQIRLDPPELGPVKVRLVSHGDRLSAEVVVSNDAIRSMIESQLPDLRQRLEQSGLNLPNLDVSTGDRGSGSSEPEDWTRQSFGIRSTASSPRRIPTVRTASGSVTVDVIV